MMPVSPPRTRNPNPTRPLSGRGGRSALCAAHELPESDPRAAQRGATGVPGREDSPSAAPRRPQPLPRVLCVDDNPFIGDGIAAMLRSSGGYEWLGQLLSADTLEADVARLRPDIMLLDIDMPGADPFEALAMVTAAHPGVRAIMLSALVRRELIDQAVSAGAWGYISKGDGARCLLTAVGTVLRGEVFFSREAAACL